MGDDLRHASTASLKSSLDENAAAVVLHTVFDIDPDEPTTCSAYLLLN